MRNALLIVMISSISLLNAQKPDKLSSVEIYNKIDKLNFLGTVLYFAAHPDDENTALIAYMANEQKARTAYLSLTRGDGGQNRIGPEIREALGVIRTHELLGARSQDGGEQFFTRAIDFGYSKHPDETLAIWDKEKVKHDVVKVIREFKPDIIVNRFDHRTPGRTHGHHTSSAMLSVESYDLAADPDYQSELLGDIEPWQTSRIFFNTSWWFYGSRDKFAAADKSNMLSVDVGVYYNNLGLSNSEIASLSRSMHKSQGFGSTGTRGSRSEFLELVKGEIPQDKENLFEGINTTWSRVKGAGHISALIEEVLKNFDFNDPSVHTDDLINIRKEISQIDDDHWRDYKLQEIDDIITQSLGLYIEAKSSKPYATIGESVTVDLEAVNRSEQDVQLKSIAIDDNPVEKNMELNTNEGTSTELSYIITQEDKYESNPYWLNEEGTLGTYTIEDLSLIGMPVNNSPLNVSTLIEVNGTQLELTRPVVYKRNDPVDGEIYEPFVILPEASVSFENPVYILPSRDEQNISVTVKGFVDSLQGTLSIRSPKSFTVSPQSVEVNIKQAGGIQNFEFSVKGPYLQETASFIAELTFDDKVLNETVDIVDYDHIPKQYIRSDAETTVQRLNINTVEKQIAYVDGAGDDVAESLEQIGYKLDLLSVDDITADKLSSYDVVIMGVRAYNIHPDLRVRKDILMDFISQGGNLIVQYNTNRGGVKGDQIAPYPMTLSRDRVTDETAPMSFTDAEHEVLNYPNKITSLDFKNWVQERGLYFPNEWDERYETPLATSDPKAPLTKGGLLIAEYGEGHFIYTGLSWFRQLPAGVPGAYRLFANLVAIGSDQQANTTENIKNGK